MTSLLPLTGLLFGAAITPGPNNFIVLDQASRRGAHAAAGPIIGVIAGSILLYAILVAGLDLIGHALPLAVRVIAVIGATYLAFLGLTLILRAGMSGSAANALPTKAPAIALFQLANPKAWILVATVAATPIARSHPLDVAMLITFVAVGCLGLWAVIGAAIAQALRKPAHRRLFDHVMGAILIFSAIGVAFDA